MKLFQMAKQTLLITTLFVVLLSCNSNEKKESQNNLNAKIKTLNPENLQTQKFTINAERDTIIKGSKGTLLRIYKNTFADKSGNTIKGQIEFELKEALSTKDIILSGLTTTSNGLLLETGGMIYLNAFAEKQELQISKDKSIGVILPNNQVKKGMKLFEGVMDSSNNINWLNPIDILNDKLIEQKNVLHQSKNVEIKDSVVAVIKEERNSEIDAILDYVESDTAKPKSQNVVKKNNNKVIQPKIINDNNDIFLNEMQNPKGINLFQQDYKTNYLFSLKKLGWANIDRLFSDPRLKEIEFITSIDNHKDFDKVYITLIIGNQNMFIPGYEKNDGTFSFTHGDFEKTKLPIGEKATILVTAYKNAKPFFSINSITISENLNISIKLEETTEDKLKQVLESKI